MSEIRIEWRFDESDCETCGMSWSDGADVYIDGELAFQKAPIAHCYAGESFSPEDILRAIIFHLGHTVVEKNA